MSGKTMMCPGVGLTKEPSFQRNQFFCHCRTFRRGYILLGQTMYEILIKQTCGTDLHPWTMIIHAKNLIHNEHLNCLTKHINPRTILVTEIITHLQKSHLISLCSSRSSTQTRFLNIYVNGYAMVPSKFKRKGLNQFTCIYSWYYCFISKQVARSIFVLGVVEVLNLLKKDVKKHSPFQKVPYSDIAFFLQFI